jgi:hypothetical protein
MKVWRFYLKPEEGKRVAKDELRYAYPLYALTQEKEYAKRFRKQRNMDLFIERSDNIDDDNVDEYLIANRSRLLSESYFETLITSDDEYRIPSFIKVLYTENELEFLNHTCDVHAIFSQLPGVLPIEIFQPEYRQALYALRYNRVIEHFNVGLGNTAEGVTDIGLQYDMFAVYMYLYGKYYRDDFISTCECKREEDLTEMELAAATAFV